MTEEIQAMEDIKVPYFKVIVDLTLQEFSDFVLEIQKQCDKYRELESIISF